MLPRLFLTGVLIVMGCGSAWASPDNPFGFETNKPPLEYGDCRYLSDDLYRGYGYSCKSAPREHPDLDYYVLQFVPDVGLCLIEGTASNVPRDDIAALVTKITDQIVQKYGPELDALRDEVQRGDRTAALANYFWVPQDGTPGIGDVAAIRMTTYETLRATNDENWITVRATLNTMTACRTAMDRFDQEEAQQEEHEGRQAF